MKLSLALIGLLVAAAAAAAPFAFVAGDDPPSIPADFRLVAEYGAGHGFWKSWKTTITAKGQVTREIPRDGGAGAAPDLTADDVRALRAKIDEVKFADLKRRYEIRDEDYPTMILEVTANQKTSKVIVYGPGELKRDAEVKRFLDLWSEVLRKVPSPNPEQTPDAD